MNLEYKASALTSPKVDDAGVVTSQGQQLLDVSG